MWDGEQGDGRTREWGYWGYGYRGMQGQWEEGGEGAKGGLREGVTERWKNGKKETYILFNSKITLLKVQ